ncbi:MAG TPA: phosphoribosylglycinamide formyltransferase [Chitinophagaceae bacterium]|nr:phosphoribosylglycinamide formyltransferase [Chitinophagaceae bacterium]
MATTHKSVILFASGAGSNARAVIRHFEHSTVARVVLLVCNNAQAGVLAIAEAHNIPFLLVDRSTFGERLFLEQLNGYRPDLIVLAGFLWKINPELIHTYSGKIINIHPALLPKYGGQGMYGRFVHEAVLAAGEKESGITIHYVNEQYDEGATIVQARCTIDPGDSADSISRKVRGLEHSFLPATVEYLLREQ